MLDENNALPLYYQLKEALKAEIQKGTWQEGQKIPSERELMESYNVSRATVNKSLNLLLLDGMITRKQGVGTFVSRTKYTQDLIGELSFNQQVIKQGLMPSSRVIYQGIETKLTDHAFDVFGLEERDGGIIKILRVRSVNGEPLILEFLYIPKQYAPNILSQDLEKIAVFEYLENTCHLKFTHSTLEIEPVAMDEFVSEHLKIETGIPALSLERIIYKGAQAIVIQKRIMRGDRGKFTLTLGEEVSKKTDYLFGLELSK